MLNVHELSLTISPIETRRPGTLEIVTSEGHFPCESYILDGIPLQEAYAKAFPLNGLELPRSKKGTQPDRQS